jgi:hypothetical protein
MWNLDETHIAAILKSGMSDREIFAIVASTHDKRWVLIRDAHWGVATADAEPPAAGLLTQARPRSATASDRSGACQVYASPRFLEEELAARRRSIVASSSCSMRRWCWRSRCCCGTVPQAGEGGGALRRRREGGRRRGAPRGRERFHGELKALDESICAMVDMLGQRFQALRASRGAA